MKTTEQAWDLREHLPECTQVHLWNPVTRLDERTPLLQSSVMEYRYSHRNMNRNCSKTQVKELAPKTSHLKTGKKGEQIAANYLISIGYKIRGKNIRLSRDEIDILAYDPFEPRIFSCLAHTNHVGHHVSAEFPECSEWCWPRSQEYQEQQTPWANNE